MTEVRIADDGGDTVLGIDFGGTITGNFWKPASELKAMFDHLPNFECRENDIMLCTFPKADVKKKQVKTILCNRNPKDMAVSYFHHFKGFQMFEYTGKWENWIRPYVQGKFMFGKYADYLNQWQTLIDQGTDYPLHTLYYEDLKKNGYEEVSKIAKFLGVELDDQTTRDIVNMCEFDKMIQAKTYPDPSQFEKVFNKGFNVFRKGTIGDWKNHFTVAQNEMFEKEWNMSLRTDTIFKFKYT